MPTFWSGRRAVIILLVTFVALRLLLLVVVAPRYLFEFGDYLYYYFLAWFSEHGYLPFIDYWLEYGPVFPAISLLVYRATRLMAGGGYEVYTFGLGVVMITVGAANLALFLRLARRLYDDRVAVQLGWVYGTLFVPILFLFWTFDEVVTFFILLALDLLLAGREKRSAVAVGMGVVTKLVPALVMPAVVRMHIPSLVPVALVRMTWRKWRRSIVYVVVVAATVALIVVPVLLVGGPMAVASFRSPTARSSWQTVWALIDGNMSTGLLGPATDHLDIAKATVPVGNSSRVPDWLKNGLFGLLYLVVFWKADLRGSPRRIVAFVAVSFLMFFLWSKGWSPQWQVFLFPLVLLALPNRQGVFFVLVLSVVNLVEWPILLDRQFNQGLWVTVPLRTVLFVWLGVVLSRLFWARSKAAST